MRYAVLATDYDGTLATQGHVDAPTLAALEKVRQSGRKLILVSGRHLPDLQSVFSRLDLFDRAVLECGVAVANALPSLKDRADIVTAGDHGAGVVEIANQLLDDDLARYDARLSRHSISLGTRADKSGEEVRISPSRNSILVAGPSASGKSTAVSGIVEQLAKQGYQFCLIDPEGDYEGFAGALSFGTAKEKPDIKAISQALADPDENLIINLLAVPVGERPNIFAGMLPVIMDQRFRTARPH